MSECGYMGLHFCVLPGDHDEALECVCECEDTIPIDDVLDRLGYSREQLQALEEE